MSSGRRWWSRLGLQDALDGAVLLFLEDLIAQRCVFERHLVGLEILDAKRIVVVQKRRDVLHPLPHVGLSHTKLYLHVEEVAQWEGLDRPRVDAGERERAAASHGGHAVAQGSRPVELQLGALQDGTHERASGLHAYGVYGRVDATAVGEVQDHIPHAVHRRVIYGLDAVPRGHGETLGHVVHAYNTAGAQVHRYAGAHLADRAETPNPCGPALGNIRVGNSLPARRQDVGEVQEPLVRGSFGYFDRPEVRLGHAHVLGLSARDGAVDVGVSEEARPPAAS